MEEVKDQVVENENVEAIESNNVDNVLNSVSDEYLKKRKRTKTISYSSILGVILALAVIIIVMSVVRVDLKPSCINDPTTYIINISNNETYIYENSEEYDEFYSAYKESFNISYLTALFTGKLGAYKIDESFQEFYANKDNKTGINSSWASELGSDYVKLSYSSPQELKEANGKTYYSITNTNESILTYEDVYFPINSENADKELTFYFGTTGAGYGYTVTRITVRANTHALYEFATELN